jgi:hypothetical protein
MKRLAKKITVKQAKAEEFSVHGVTKDSILRFLLKKEEAKQAVAMKKMATMMPQEFEFWDTFKVQLPNVSCTGLNPRLSQGHLIDQEEALKRNTGLLKQVSGDLDDITQEEADQKATLAKLDLTEQLAATEFKKAMLLQNEYNGLSTKAKSVGTTASAAMKAMKAALADEKKVQLGDHLLIKDVKKKADLEYAISAVSPIILRIRLEKAAQNDLDDSLALQAKVSTSEVASTQMIAGETEDKDIEQVATADGAAVKAAGLKVIGAMVLFGATISLWAIKTAFAEKPEEVEMSSSSSNTGAGAENAGEGQVCGLCRTQFVFACGCALSTSPSIASTCRAFSREEHRSPRRTVRRTGKFRLASLNRSNRTERGWGWGALFAGIGKQILRSHRWSHLALRGLCNM